MAAAEWTLNKYLIEVQLPQPPASAVLTSSFKTLCETALKLQSGTDREPSPQGSDLDQRRAERAKLLALKAAKVSANVSADDDDA